MTTFDDERAWFLTWMRDAALPLWSGAALDPEGGFYEALTHDGRPVLGADKRWRVQARQAFSFARAERLGLIESGREASDHAWRFMIDEGLQAKEGFVRSFVHVFAPDGTVRSDLRDSYDHAFALLASAERRLVYNDPEADLVDELAERYFEALRHPEGGFEEGFPPALPRRQNPHMHLLEAALLRLQAGPSTFAAAARDEVLRLYRAHFWDEEAGALREFFGEDWRLHDDKGEVTEPGHMAEWLWLLAEAGSGPEKHLVRLYSRARELGRIGPHGILADNHHLTQGSAAQQGRLWCQTEHIRAAATLARVTGEERYREEAGELLAVFRRLYLEPVAAGGWADRVAADGQIASDVMPTSLLYHVVTLADELLREA